MIASQPVTAPGGTWKRQLGIAWVHLAVLWAFAFAQPLFEVLADSPEFFVARRNTSSDIVVLACALILVPPTLMVLAEAALLRLPRVRQGLHLALVATLAAAFVLQVLIDWLGAGAAVLILLGVIGGLLLALAYARVPGVRTALTVLAPAPLLLLAWFLLLSPVEELVLPGSASSAAQTRAAGNGASVVMLVFDEFSVASLMDARGRIDRSRFPNFAALADRSTWYRNATTVADRTTNAVPALLTGNVTHSGQLPTAADHPNSIFTLLGDRYDFDVEEPATDVCPERLCGEEERAPTDERLRSLVSDLSVVSLHLLLPEQLADDLPPIDRSFGNFRDQGGDAGGTASQDLPADAIRTRVPAFEEFLHGLERDSGRPTLHLLHVGLPHRPWEYLPDGRRYRTVRGPPPGESLVEAPEPTRQMLQEYMLQLTHVDHLIGRLLEKLDDSEALVVTADHGIAFHPGDQLRSVTPKNIGEIAGVPLFIKAPGQRRGRVDDSYTRTVDIVPTVADLLDLEPGWRPDGRSLEGGGGPTTGRVALLSVFGATTAAPFDAFVRSRDAAAARIRQTFGRGVDGLYEAGPDKELVGTDVGKLPVAAATGAEAELDDPQALEKVNPDGRLLPLYVSGKLVGTDAELRLAIALNGRISAVSGAYHDRGELVFTALVRPEDLRPGSNSLALYALEGDSAKPTLVPLQRERELRFELTESSGSPVLKGPNGEIEVEPKAAQGFIEAIAGGGDAPLVVLGWAVTARKTPVDRVLLFAGDKFLGSAKPSREREGVAAYFHKRSALRSGYSISVSPTAVKGVDEASLRVFAVDGSQAAELPRLRR